MMDARLRAAWAGATLALTWGAFASADEFAERRATCEPILTVVKASCVVENLYRCPQGENYSETYWRGQLNGAELYDKDYSPIFYAPSASEGDIRWVQETQRAYSLSEILKTGRTLGAYSVQTDEFLFVPVTTRMTIEVSLTDEVRHFGGRPYQVAQSEMRWEMGEGRVWVGKGPMLIDTERRLMLNDEGLTTLDGVTEPTEDPILQIIERAQPGFMATGPVNCEAISSLTSHPPLQRRLS